LGCRFSAQVRATGVKKDLVDLLYARPIRPSILDNRLHNAANQYCCKEHDPFAQPGADANPQASVTHRLSLPDVVLEEIFLAFLG
jgi:hypothetical protein